MTKSGFFRLKIKASPVLLLGVLLFSSACTSPSTGNIPASQADLTQSTEQMTRDFSTPNLTVLLGGVEFSGKPLNILNPEQTGTLRANQHNSVPMLNSATFAPAHCKTLMLDTYTDDDSYTAVWADAILDNSNLLRLQLTSFGTAQKSQAAIQSQVDLAQQCPTFEVTAPSHESSTQQMTAQDWPLEHADRAVLTQISSDGITQVGIFSRVGNLDLRLYFDGPEALSKAKESKADIEQLLNKLRIALITKKAQ